MEDLFGVGGSTREIRFEFETVFSPFERLSLDTIPPIDVVTLDREGRPCRPIEVKLTVVPDDSSARKAASEWSAEMVVRPVTSAYALMSMWSGVGDRELQNGFAAKVTQLLRPIWRKVGDWGNISEVSSSRDKILSSCEEVLKLFVPFQRPFLAQTIWKTEGKRAALAPQCLDVFAWSDLAIVTLPLDLAKNKRPLAGEKVNRPLREVARHLRTLYDLSTTGCFVYDRTYRGMALGTQTDKSFSVNGLSTIRFLRHQRLQEPVFSAQVLPDLILNGGEELLCPERRFDAAVYYTCRDAIKEMRQGDRP